jgi:hypothetical protein
MRRPLIIVLAFMAFGLATPAWADNTTCANAEPLIIGSQANDTLPSSGNIYFKTRLTAGRSYILWAHAPFQDAGEGATALTLALFSDTTCATGATVVNGTEREPLDNISGADVDQIAIKPTASTTYVLRITNGFALAYTIQVVAIETSLFSPWWYVGGNNQSFVTFRNNMADSTTVTLQLYHNDGSLCGSEDIVIGANATSFRRVNDYPGCVTAAFGSAAITFFGPPNGIGANTTVIDAVQGISFDEPFNPRMYWSILNRS